jgi:hypothetical protein
VIVWDRGTYSTIDGEDASAALARGRLKVWLEVVAVRDGGRTELFTRNGASAQSSARRVDQPVGTGLLGVEEPFVAQTRGRDALVQVLQLAGVLLRACVGRSTAASAPAGCGSHMCRIVLGPAARRSATASTAMAAPLSVPTQVTCTGARIRSNVSTKVNAASTSAVIPEGAGPVNPLLV